VTQRHKALHGVDPKPASCSTSDEPQRGQDAGVPTSTSGSMTRPSGGAMPNPRSLPFAASLIQSVVHAGDSCVRTSTSSYDDSNAVRTSRAITSVAGQPE